MKRTTHIVSITAVFVLLLTSSARAQYASERVRTFGRQQIQQPPAEQRNIHHNRLTVSNSNRLPSYTISRSYQQKIPANMRSRGPHNYPPNKPRVLASNSPKLREKKQPKRPPALPVVF